MPNQKKYDKRVFINCPFDDEYRNLLNAITFAIYNCGFVVICAQQETDSGEVRFDKIKRMIANARFGVHDISRIQVDSSTQYPRFNMPLELGVFIGATTFGNAAQRKKKTLILDVDKYRYQAIISDIAGQDIRAHNGDIVMVITHIRNWLNEASPQKTIPGGKAISKRYAKFRETLPDICTEKQVDINEITYKDFCHFATTWIEQNKN